MDRNLVYAGLLIVVLFFQLPMSGQQTQYRVRPVGPPPVKRGAAVVAKEKLPANAQGAMPTYDGEPFHLNLKVQDHTLSEEEIRALAQQTLQGLAPAIAPADLQYRPVTAAEKTTRPSIDSEIDRRLSDDKKRISGQVGPLGKGSEQAIQNSTRQLRQQMTTPQPVFVFEQKVQGVVIDNSGLRITQPKPGYVSITGRVFNTVHVANPHTLSADRAVAAARAHVSRSTKLAAGDTPQPELVLLPYGSDLRFAWRLDIAAVEGSYRFWIDAGNGQVLQLEPQFFFDAGTGLVFNPAPPTTDTKDFDVDLPSSNLYKLSLASRLSVHNSGADGKTSADLTIASGSGSANFNVSPLNGTAVQRTSDANYNSRFQEINTYAWVLSDMNWMEGMGSRKFDAITAKVNFDDPCGNGVNNACAKPLSNALEFGIGGATTSASTACHDVFNSAIDATVITHEFGHILSARQIAIGGGTLTSSINEGLSDYWAATVFNNDTFGKFWAANCAAPGEDGFAPRQAEANGVFPDHRSLGGVNTDPHADGQMIDWALWSARTRLNRSALGTLAIDTNLLKALTTAGVGVAGCTGPCTDAQVHASYIDLLQQLASQFGGDTNTLKIFSGFADAGLFLSDQDAIIDINSDFLARGGGSPVFTVWGGRNYTVSAITGAATNSAVFNPRFQVEVANDAAFTQNLTSSGFLTSIAVNGVGVATSSWTLPAAAWNTLKAGSTLCFRLTTTDSTGGTQRLSTSPGNGFIAAAVPCVTINESGTCECSCNNQSSAGPDRTIWALFLPPLGLVVLRRRLRRKDRAS